MSRCVEAAAVAATVPGAGVGSAGLRPPMVPRQASFFPPPVPNPFVQQTRMGAAKRIQVRGVDVREEMGPGEMEPSLWQGRLTVGGGGLGSKVSEEEMSI